MITNFYLTKKHFISIFFCGMIFNAYPQQEWKDGLIIKQAGDTLKGEILFEDWELSPRSVLFRWSEKDAPVSFSSNDLVGFSLAEPKIEFQSKTLSIKYYSKSQVGQGHNPVNKEYNGKVFLEVLLRSEPVVLYSMLDDEKEERYFLEKNKIILELLDVEYTTTFNDAAIKIHRPLYREQLKQLLNECPSLNTSNLSYSSKDILSLLKTYHSYCKIDYRLLFEQENVHDLICLKNPPALQVVMF